MSGVFPRDETDVGVYCRACLCTWLYMGLILNYWREKCITLKWWSSMKFGVFNRIPVEKIFALENKLTPLLSSIWTCLYKRALWYINFYVGLGSLSTRSKPLVVSFSWMTVCLGFLVPDKQRTTMFPPEPIFVPSVYTWLVWGFVYTVR